MFLILNGFVKVYSIDTQSNQKIYIIYRPGDPFPVTNIADLYLPVYFEAIDTVEAAILPAPEFRHFMSREPDILSYLMQRLITGVTILTERIANLQHTEAQQRIIHNILWLAKHLGEINRNRCLIRGPITHQIIADSSNFSRETVSRTIKQLERAGLIDYRKNTLLIPNLKRLEAEIL